MTNPLRLLCRLLAVSLLVHLLSASAQALPGVVIVVKTMDTSPKNQKDPKKKGEQKEIEQNKLAITVRNVSKEDHKGLKVNYYFFSKDVGEPGTKILKQGTVNLDLAPGKEATVESEQAEATFIAAHVKNKNERVRASGTKMVGHAVQVFAGDKLLGEAFSGESAQKALAESPKH